MIYNKNKSTKKLSFGKYQAISYVHYDSVVHILAVDFRVIEKKVK
jgi:hypothetical protein